MLTRLGVLIESRVARAVLIALIVLALLPFDDIERLFRGVFAIVFGLELAIRVPLLIRRRRDGESRPAELLFIAVDLLALVSFLPLEAWLPEQVEALRLLRLARLLVLLRFARELAADVYTIVTRREQLQQLGLVTVAVAAMAFVSAVILSQLKVPHNYDAAEGGRDGFFDQIWWSFRQLESADNLVANLHVHPLVGLLSLVLTVTGVFVISFLIGIGTNVVEQVVRAERHRAVSFSGHTIVVGPIEESEVLIREFVRIHMKNRRDFRDVLRRYLRWFFVGGVAPRTWRRPRMALLGTSAEAPSVLLEPNMRWVVYRQGHGGDTTALARVGAERAKRIILLGDPGPDADAITVATLSSVRELNSEAHVFLELLSSQNFATVRAIAQSPRTFPLDVSWLLGLFLLHHLVVPGVERLYRYLLTAAGSELYSHVYQELAELEAIAALADDDGMIQSARLAELAAQHNVVFVGVFLGARTPKPAAHDLIDLEGLVPWVNPLDAPADPRLVALGASAGRVPVRAIRGIIAIGANYKPVRAFARGFAEGAAGESPSGSPLPAGPEIGAAARPPSRVLVVGYGDAVASLTARLAQITEGARVVVATDGGRAHVRSLRGALRKAGLSVVETAAGRLTAGLERGGQLEIHADEFDDPLATALKVLAEEEMHAIVFVAEDDARDPDARTALRLLRLAEGLLRLEGRPPHVLAELRNVAKGARARDQVRAAFEEAGREPPRVTLVSTEQIRNYFMVHSAFVPGIGEVYGQLLGEVGQDLARLPVSRASTTLGRCARALRARKMIPLGFELADGEVRLNPPPDELIEDVTGVFTIGEVDSDWTDPG